MAASDQISHHNIFQVYLPTTQTANEPDLVEVFAEESHLLGLNTKNYGDKKREKDPFLVVLYPSFLITADTFYPTKFEREKFINSCIDNEFINMLLYISPVYEIPKFIEYHFLKYSGKDNIFIKHIEYVILPLIRSKIGNLEKGNDYPEFDIVNNVIAEWISEKKRTTNKINSMTKISKAKNVIVNNQSNISDQQINYNKKGKEKNLILWIGLIISLGMLIITALSNWDQIVSIF